MKLIRASSLAFLALCIAQCPYSAPEQSTADAPSDPLDQRVGSFELKDETFGDALGRLNQSFDISVSVEGLLPTEGVVTNPKFRARIEGHTVTEVLTWLCALDTRYTWARDGNMVNIFPRGSRDDRTYLFNRILPVLQFENVSKADEAAIGVIHQLGDPSEILICLSVGGTQTFAKPWTATFRDITVRQALNRIAQQLGPTYGWQIGGKARQRLIVFQFKLGGRVAAP
jgi:hypothetical protein